MRQGDGRAGAVVSGGNGSPQVQCEGKHAFASPAEASKALHHMRSGSQAYRCGYCRSWHIGHKAPRSATMKAGRRRDRDGQVPRR